MTAQPEKSRVVRGLKYGKPLISCRIDPTGRYVFAGSEDDGIARWDLDASLKEPKYDTEKAPPPTPFLAHDGWPFALAVTADGKTLISGGTDGSLIWWPAASETAPLPIRKVTNAHQGWVRGIAISPDGQQVATCGNDSKIRLWAMDDGRLLAELSDHARPVYQVLYRQDGKELVSSDLMGQVLVWDLAAGKQTRKLDAAKLHTYEGGQAVDYGGVRDLSFSPDQTLLACAGLINASNPLGAVSNPAVLLLDWKSGETRKLQRPKEDLKGVAWSARFHPDGFLVAATGGTSGGFLWFTHPDQENEFFKLSLPNTARALDLHSDGVHLATAHHDGHVRIVAMTESS